MHAVNRDTNWKVNKPLDLLPLRFCRNFTLLNANGIRAVESLFHLPSPFAKLLSGMAPAADGDALLEQAGSILTLLEADLGSSLPLVALGSHFVLAILGSAMLGCSLKCNHQPVQKRRLFAYAMRVGTELMPMTLITAASLTVVVLAHPVPIALRVVSVMAILCFATVVTLIYGFAFLRFHHLHNHRSERMSLRDHTRHEDMTDAEDTAHEDMALCFYLNCFFSACWVRSLRSALLIIILIVMTMAVTHSEHDAHALLVSTPLLFFLVLNSAANLLRPAIPTRGKDYKHLLEAARHMDPSDGARGAAVSAARRVCEQLEKNVGLMLPSPSREVVLRVSATLGWHHELEDMAPASASTQDAISKA